MEQVKNIVLEDGEFLTSYYVTALFRSVLVNPVIKINKNKLEEDAELHNRTSMTVRHIITLLEFFPKKIYFLFQGRFYEEIEGAVMGFNHKPNTGHPLHGVLRDQGH